MDIDMKYQLGSLTFVASKVVSTKGGVHVFKGQVEDTDIETLRVVKKGNKKEKKNETTYKENARKLKHIPGVLRWIASISDDARVFMAYEGYNRTFNEYLESLESLIHQNVRVVNKYTRMNPNFIKIIKDIVVTIRDAHLSGVDHLHLSTETILLERNNRVKIFGFSHVDNPNFQPCTPDIKAKVDYRDIEAEVDYCAIALIIETEFRKRHMQDANTELPLELEYFINFLNRKRLEDDMKNIEHHPFFLGPEARLFYYLDADTSINYMLTPSSERKFFFEEAIELFDFPREGGINSWMNRVRENKDIYKVYNFNPNTINYNNSAKSYLRFCKNVAVHMKGDLQKSVKETSVQVQRLWPGFLPLLHAAMVDVGARVPNMDDFDKYVLKD